MAYVTVTTKVEIEFTSGVWTDMTTPGYHDNRSRLQVKRGVANNRQMFASSASFSLDNSSEVFTPGNTSSTYFNKLRRGVGVRISTTYSATTRYHFRGVVMDIQPVFPGLPGAMRVAVKAIGISSQLQRQTDYQMGLLSSFDVDNAATSIMTAAGWTLYSFADSAFTVPYVYSRANPLSDLVALWQSDPTQLLFEDGQGRLKTVSVIGGYSSPTHTWGVASGGIVPDGALSPDTRWESQYSRQKLSYTAITPGTLKDVELYKHPFNSEMEQLEVGVSPSGLRTLSGVFERTPYSVSQKFGLNVSAFADTGLTLWAAMTSSQISFIVVAQGKLEVKPYDEFLFDNERMIASAASYSNSAGLWTSTVSVSRASAGTIAAGHAAGLPVLKRPSQATSFFITGKAQAFDSTSPTIKVAPANITSAAYDSLSAGTILQVDDEYLEVNSKSGPTGGYYFIGVNRARFGTTAQNHGTYPQELTLVSRVTFSYVAEAIPGSLSTYTTSSDSAGQDLVTSVQIGAGGLTPTPKFENGNHIGVQGNRWWVEFSNYNTSAVRYLASMIIMGKELELREANRQLAYERAIPGIPGIEEGPALSMPYGVSDISIATGATQAGMRVGRIASPWITTPPFTANIDANVTSILTAEIGDLVRWTGTGTWREKIDEFYRILGVSYEWDENDIMTARYTLEPASDFRDPSKCWFHSFDYRDDHPTVNGYFSPAALPDIYPSGLGNFTSSSPDWFAGGAYWNSLYGWQESYVGPSGATPAHLLCNVNSSDMVVGTAGREYSSPGTGEGNHYTFPANTGGYGVLFRANSSGTQHWRAFMNSTSDLVILWNTTDGVVATYPWTLRSRSANLDTAIYEIELEVRCQGNRIRVYADCLSEPVIDATSTRFNTNTYAGLGVVRTVIVEQSASPAFWEFYAQAL